MLLRFLTIAFIISISPTAIAMSPMSSTVVAHQGKPAVDITLPTTDGKLMSVLSAREGKKAILIFWATWCPHCRTELARVNAMLPQLEAKGIKPILVNEGESKEEVMEYLLKKGISLPSFIDEEGALQEPYDIMGIPTLAFIDEKGNFIGMDHGLPDDLDAVFK